LRTNGRLLAVDIEAPSRRSLFVDAYLRVAEKRHAREVLGDGLVSAIAEAGFEIAKHRTFNAWPIPFQLIEARNGPTTA
jgi:hypothetical protein